MSEAIRSDISHLFFLILLIIVLTQSAGGLSGAAYTLSDFIHKSSTFKPFYKLCWSE